jgi:hypothetical protein
MFARLLFNLLLATALLSCPLRCAWSAGKESGGCSCCKGIAGANEQPGPTKSPTGSESRHCGGCICQGAVSPLDGRLASFDSLPTLEVPLADGLAPTVLSAGCTAEQHPCLAALRDGAVGRSVRIALRSLLI